MKKANIGVAIFLWLIGAIVMADAVRLGFRWDPRMGPGAGYLPFYLALGTMICTSIVIFRGIKKLKEGPGAPLIPEGGLKPILWVLIPSTVMVVLIEFVGVHVAAGMYLAFYMREVGKIEWLKIALVSILVPVSLYIIFDRLFLIPLPGGWLGEYVRLPF
jgi:putative tricarboxylic transport membrane protein